MRVRVPPSASSARNTRGRYGLSVGCVAPSGPRERSYALCGVASRRITTREPSMRKVVLLVALVAAVAAIAGAAGTGKAFAYGRADHPIAQVEISGNCNNPSFDLCQHVGLGGVWAWAELDTAGGITSSGTMDYTLTFCDHAGPGGGPHSAGAFGHPGEGVWYTVNSLGAALAAGAAPFFDTS